MLVDKYGGYHLRFEMTGILFREIENRSHTRHMHSFRYKRKRRKKIPMEEIKPRYKPKLSLSCDEKCLLGKCYDIFVYIANPIFVFNSH